MAGVRPHDVRVVGDPISKRVLESCAASDLQPLCIVQKPISINRVLPNVSSTVLLIGSARTPRQTSVPEWQVEASALIRCFGGRVCSTLRTFIALAWIEKNTPFRECLAVTLLADNSDALLISSAEAEAAALRLDKPIVLNDCSAARIRPRRVPVWCGFDAPPENSLAGRYLDLSQSPPNTFEALAVLQQTYSEINDHHCPTNRQPATRCTEIDLVSTLADAGIPLVPHRLVDSASATAKAVAELGLPVVLKASGSELTDHYRWGGQSDPQSTVSGAKQAFRQVLNACAAHHGTSPLQGVLVCKSPAAGNLPVANAMLATCGGRRLLRVEGPAGSLVAPVAIRSPDTLKLELQSVLPSWSTSLALALAEGLIALGKEARFQYVTLAGIHPDTSPHTAQHSLRVTAVSASEIQTFNR